MRTKINFKQKGNNEMANIGDKFIFHSAENGDYSIKIVNINDFREPSMKYGADVYDKNGAYAGDVLFFSEEFINGCEQVNKGKVNA